MSFAALILAAGESRRMGAANKLLLELNGLPLIAHALTAVEASRVQEIAVVLGHDAETLRPILEAHARRPIRFVMNTDYRRGLGSSLASGLTALNNQHDGVVICLGDMPYIGAEVIDTLCEALQPGDYAAVPVWEGQWGNPVLLSATASADAVGLTGDRGARVLLKQHAARVREVPAPGDAVLRDIDRARDLGVC